MIFSEAQIEKWEKEIRECKLYEEISIGLKEMGFKDWGEVVVDDLWGEAAYEECLEELYKKNITPYDLYRYIEEQKDRERREGKEYREDYYNFFNIYFFIQLTNDLKDLEYKDLMKKIKAQDLEQLRSKELYNV